jgi:hypothetical protein
LQRKRAFEHGLETPIPEFLFYLWKIHRQPPADVSILLLRPRTALSSPTVIFRGYGRIDPTAASSLALARESTRRRRKVQRSTGSRTRRTSFLALATNHKIHPNKPRIIS